MKKQFLRVKQLADQTFSRAGKTEALSDDLQDADRRVDLIRNACQNTSKKLSSTLIAQGQDVASKEKRLKKSVEYAVGLSMIECEKDEDSLLGTIINDCGKLQIALANEFVEYESRVEEKVVTPLQTVAEDASIIKLKQKLNKAVLDMDSARGRLQGAIKHNAGQPGTAKVDSVREEFEDAELKMEQCRDTLAIEMYQLLSKEADLAAKIVDYVHLQRAYHEKAIKTLDTFIPDLESVVQESPIRPVFGAPLEEHLKVTGRQIAWPIEMCVCALIEQGMDEEGLFRVAGGSSRVRRLKLGFDAGCLTHEGILHLRDPHVVGGVLKSYLRELPEPLMTHSLYLDWMSTLREQGSTDERLKALWTVVHKLPTPNRDNLRYLVKFLSLLCRNQERNKMSPQNVAIVMAPNLIWSPQQDGNMGLNMNTTNLHSVIVDSLVSYADYFFPEEIDFYVTLSQEHAKEIVNAMAALMAPSAVSVPSNAVSPGNTSTQRHARNGSGDSQLVDSAPAGGMQRAQSTGSLSDQCGSPPHGSPKPVTRRKNKPAAPVPPNVATVTYESGIIHHQQNTQKTPHKAERPGKPPPPVTNACTVPVRPVERPTKPPPPVILPQSTHTATPSTAASVSASAPGTKPPMVTDHITDKPAQPHDLVDALNEDLSVLSKPSIGFEHIMLEAAGPTPSLAPSSNSSAGPAPAAAAPASASLTTILIPNSTASSPAPTSSTTSPVPDVTPPDNAEKPSNESSAAKVSPGVQRSSDVVTITSCGAAPNSAPVSTSTLERKKPQRPFPVAAPRTTLIKAAETQPRGGGVSSGMAPLATAEDEFVGVTLRRTNPDSLPDPSTKPAVPERPATLQRPLSSSFRVNRPPSDPSTTSTTTTTTSTTTTSTTTNYLEHATPSTGTQPLDDELRRERWNLVSEEFGNMVRTSPKKRGAAYGNVKESKLQRSASVGNRPTALSVSLGKSEWTPKSEALTNASTPTPTWNSNSTSTDQLVTATLTPLSRPQSLPPPVPATTSIPGAAMTAHNVNRISGSSDKTHKKIKRPTVPPPKPPIAFPRESSPRSTPASPRESSPRSTPASPREPSPRSTPASPREPFLCDFTEDNPL